MTVCRRIIQITGLLVPVLASLFLFTTSAFSAVSPLVSVLPGIMEGSRAPVRLAGDQSGFIYVTDPRSGGVRKYDGSGSLVAIFPISKKIFGAAIDLNGNLLVSQGTSVVVLNSRTGALVTQFGTFLNANGIAVDGNGFIYVTDSLNNCIQKFNSTYTPVNTGIAAAGKPANSFGAVGRAANGQFMQPTGISYEKASNQLAIADTFNGRIQFYSTGGVYQKTIGNYGAGPLMFTSPQAVAFEYSQPGNVLSRIYVVDAYQATIQVIDAATGGFLDYIGNYGSKNGEMLTPGDILLDSTDSLNNRLVVPNGNGALALYGIDKVTGRCGAAHNSSFSFAPTTGLCRNGFVANFSGTGPWSWDCFGQYGGASATCSASLSSSQMTVTVVANNGASGSVTSNPSGINCLGGTCTASLPLGGNVTLMPRANAGSTFTGWSGDCASAGIGDCTLSTTASRTATATFVLNPKARVSGISFGTITSAYDKINSSGTIETQAVTFVENVNLNRGTAVTLQGGYDSTYTNRTGYTELNGTLTIDSGSLVVDGLVIR